MDEYYKDLLATELDDPRVGIVSNWTDSDNDPESPEQAGWDEIHEEPF